MADSTARFSDRVEDYVRYRPGYPHEAIAWIGHMAGISAGANVADIGAGTGISSRALLKAGFRVYGVEPNVEMRRAAEKELGSDSGFRSVHGTAESTGLPDRGVDLVFAGQAFHWFDRTKARAEFSRILKPRGGIALAWNRRRNETPLLSDYEAALKRLCPEYKEVNHQNIDEKQIHGFFGGATVEKFTCPNAQAFDLEGFLGRAFSSSYTPRVGKPGRKELKAELEAIFARHQAGGRIEFAYETLVYFNKATGATRT